MGAVRPQIMTGDFANSYETVAASQTDQVMGGAGAAGDYLSHIWVVPATTSPGVVTMKDGGGSAISLYAGGTVSAALQGFDILVNAVSLSGAWKISTGANMSVICYGSFT